MRLVCACNRFARDYAIRPACGCGASCAYHVCPRAGVPLKLDRACDRGAVSCVEGAT